MKVRDGDRAERERFIQKRRETYLVLPRKRCWTGDNSPGVSWATFPLPPQFPPDRMLPDVFGEASRLVHPAHAAKSARRSS